MRQIHIASAEQHTSRYKRVSEGQDKYSDYPNMQQDDSGIN
jgi:hypothetical protein